MILYNIAGHSRRAKGALAHNGKYEHYYTTDLQRRVAAKAPSFWEVIMDDEGYSLRDVLKGIGDLGYGLDIHFNNNNPKATGVEVFVNSHTTEKNKTLATTLVRSVSKAIGLPIRRAEKSRDYKYSHESYPGKLAIVDNTSIPFILLEVCFLNQNDLSLYEGKEDLVAQAIVDTYGLVSIGDLDPKTEKVV